MSTRAEGVRDSEAGTCDRQRCGFGRERAVGRKTSEAAGPYAEPDTPAPAGVEAAVSETAQEQAKLRRRRPR